MRFISTKTPISTKYLEIYYISSKSINVYGIKTFTRLFTTFKVNAMDDFD